MAGILLAISGVMVLVAATVGFGLFMHVIRKKKREICEEISRICG